MTLLVTVVVFGFCVQSLQAARPEDNGIAHVVTDSLIQTAVADMALTTSAGDNEQTCEEARKFCRKQARKQGHPKGSHARKMAFKDCMELDTDYDPDEDC